jgi:hypothetical protein
MQDLVQTYKSKNIPEVIAAKTSEFWGSLKRHPTESVDAYYNRFNEILDDLADLDEPISTKSAICQFLFTLGTEFEPIQLITGLIISQKIGKPRIGPSSWLYVEIITTLSSLLSPPIVNNTHWILTLIKNPIKRKFEIGL